MTAFGHAFYDVLEARGISTRSTEAIAKALVARGFPVEEYGGNLRQQYVWNWTHCRQDGTAIRPPKVLLEWMEEGLHLTHDEVTRLAVVAATGREPYPPG